MSKCDMTGKNPHEKCEEILMVTSSTCTHCNSAKKILKEQITSGKVKVINEKSEGFENIVNKFNISGVPTFIIDNKKVCDLVGNNKDFHLKCTDGSEVDIK